MPPKEKEASKDDAEREGKRKALEVMEKEVKEEEGNKKADTWRAGTYELKRWFTKNISKSFPDVGKNLKRAGMKITPEEFILQQFLAGGVMTVILSIVVYLLSTKLGFDFLITMPLLVVLYVFLFVWLLQTPVVITAKRQRDLNRDILYAGRDILIGLKSGVPLFNAMVNVSENYGVASEEFTKIVERINSGMPAEVALQESSDMNTSKSFRRIVMQIVTSMRSGSDVAASLEIVLGQISREQVIELRRYGQKLNPLTMFYMLFGIIIPSLGIAVGIVLTSFIAVRIEFGTLLVICILIAGIQYMFLSIIKSSRPDFEI